MIIDYQTLSEYALKGIAEIFVTQHLSEVDGELNFSDWTEDVIRKVKAGELLIEFSQVDESVTLKTPDEIDFSEEK